jgi:ketosteroid isomerase-like protein
MSQNVELIRRAFYPPSAPDLVRLFADRDAVTAWLEPFVHPDLETLEQDPSIPSAKGVRAFVDAYAEWLSAWETFHATPTELHDLGDRVLAVVRMGGRTKTHGVEVEQWSAVIFEVADGLVRAVKFFTTAEDARREAGLVR